MEVVRTGIEGADSILDGRIATGASVPVSGILGTAESINRNGVLDIDRVQNQLGQWVTSRVIHTKPGERR